MLVHILIEFLSIILIKILSSYSGYFKPFYIYMDKSMIIIEIDYFYLSFINHIVSTYIQYKFYLIFYYQIIYQSEK